ncbi:hypothetical protein EF294_07375 [Gordonia oryzae]|uniref:Uncharacterized protein n=1 Tax=Gordonia oryzae TaxID=2487349 RepID=A0A3N4GRM6_9ACTN|nr:hypothetical protein [Gordonia oryzae]RPA64895.1 hypothetical protein EF294_07375 [Gordonia oryzae]
MSAKIIRCSRCRRRLRNPATDTAWNVTVERGQIVGHLCPDCQTPEENAEAEINLATLEYGYDPAIGLLGRPRIDSP